MNKTFQNSRILAISPSRRGFGFAVLKGNDTLLDCGVKWAKGDKNSHCLLRVKEMIVEHQPGVITLEDTSAKDSKRGPRTRALTKKIIALASNSKVKVKLFENDQIRKAFFADGKGTKHDLAQIVANQFSEELTHQLPPKRRAWENESFRMAIFEAVALALMFYDVKRRETDIP